ncbi:hypothetical protein F4779DRAFT_597888 [Xylariaceae sp. FL0662B]|nr:hypothetical protein F4779DRAFT_597888 [Xylariaceae sp. FL0662B]
MTINDNNKMVGAYDVQDYLLDRANIHDTIFRMILSFDTKTTKTLVTSVYTPRPYIDYSEVLGGSPQEMSSEVWAKSLDPVLDAFDSTQHTVQDLLIELPQPTTKKAIKQPQSCNVIAYAVAWLYRRDSEGQPRVMVRRNGARYELEMVRVKELEEKGENPWRVSKHKLVFTFQDRNLAEAAPA